VGHQGSTKRYYCKPCDATFSVDHSRKEPSYWIAHIDGLPFRKLGDQIALTGKQIFVKVRLAINLLLWNWQLTKEVCDPALFSGILIMDGKYIAVKGFNQKIPFIYGIDYLTHDIPHGDLFSAEDELSFSQYFSKLKELGYDLRIVVADDRAGLKNALLKVFPYAKLQLCHNHFLENIRSGLKVRTVATYQHFFNSLRLHVFLEGTDEQKVTDGLKHVMSERTGSNAMLKNLLLEINERRKPLFTYLTVPGCPNNTNLIELYNSHLQGRLKSIKGFQSFQSAQRWCNAWMIRRRTKPLTDCDTKFKHLNKHASLEFTIKKQAQWPEQLTNLGINRVKNSKLPSNTN